MRDFAEDMNIHCENSGSYMHLSTWQLGTTRDRNEECSVLVSGFQLELKLQGQDKNGVFEIFCNVQTEDKK